MTSESPVLSVSDLVVEYVTDGYAIRPLDGFCMEAAASELLALVGPSGSGKTTLLSVLSAMIPATSGTVTMNGTNVLKLGGRELEDFRRSQIGIVFQGFNLVPSLSARENVAAPLLIAGVRRGEALRRADAVLDEVDMADRAHHRPSRLSGGQQQRVAVARGLVGDPKILLADEPTANLDLISAEAVIGLLQALRDRGRTIIISTHDARLLPAADRVVEMTQEPTQPEETSKLANFAAGEVIFRQSDPSDYVYEIRSGTIEVIRELVGGGEERLATREAGNYVGELGPILGFPRSATVRAVSKVSLAPLTAHQFKAKTSTHSRGSD
ncbi:MAG: ATP-binding cassette domain-containing protein [Acidimicrobiales bacterium]